MEEIKDNKKTSTKKSQPYGWPKRVPSFVFI